MGREKISPIRAGAYFSSFYFHVYLLPSVMPEENTSVNPALEEGYRKEGKGRRCYFASGWVKERELFILFFISSWCNSFNSSYRPGAIHPNLPIVLTQNSKCSKGMNRFYPPNSIDDLYLLFCLYPSSMESWFI